jgi:cytochrome c-type biogenesis protein CcmH
MRRLLFFLLLMLSLGGGTSSAKDFAPEVEREAAKVFGNVMSPYCPGKLIADCPSAPAVELREKIRERIAAGESGDAIRDELYETFGEYLRAAPTGSGFDLVAWVVPPLLIAIGAVAILIWIRRRRPAPPATVSAASIPLDPSAKARIAAELARTGSD